MKCPICNRKLIRKRLRLFDGCLGAIVVEFTFWTVAGFLALLLYKFAFPVIAAITCIILVVVFHRLDHKYSVHECIFCGKEFQMSELKNELQ